MESNVTYDVYSLPELIAIIKQDGNDDAYKEFQRRWKEFEDTEKTESLIGKKNQ